jgi:hypothetical protein
MWAGLPRTVERRESACRIARFISRICRRETSSPFRRLQESPSPGVRSHRTGPCSPSRWDRGFAVLWTFNGGDGGRPPKRDRPDPPGHPRKRAANYGPVSVTWISNGRLFAAEMGSGGYLYGDRANKAPWCFPRRNSRDLISGLFRGCVANHQLQSRHRSRGLDLHARSARTLALTAERSPCDDGNECDGPPTSAVSWLRAS